MIKITPELSDRIRAALKDQLGDEPLGTIVGIHEDGTVDVKWNPDAAAIVMRLVFDMGLPVVPVDIDDWDPADV